MQQAPIHNPINAARLRALLGERGLEVSLCVFDEIDSTNSEAKRMAVEERSTPALIVAAAQSAGRGRMGRSFYSPAETGAYFSILFDAEQSMETTLSITGAASVAVMRAIRKLCGKQTAIKWVNDLYLNGKKVCGILTEAVSGLTDLPKVILGIGVNLSTEVFPPELSQKAGSLGESALSREALIAEVVRELWPYLQNPTDQSWLEDYRIHSCVIGKEIRWSVGESAYTGRAVGIDGRGALEVRLSDGSTEFLRTGEISIFTDETDVRV